LTAKQKAFKKKLIQKIHLSKKYKEFYKDNRDVYRDLIKKHFGADSSTDMNIEQLISFCDWMNDKIKALPVINKNSASSSQLEALKNLWREKARDKKDSALRAFIYRITKNNYLHIQNISKKDAQTMIAILKKMKTEEKK